MKNLLQICTVILIVTLYCVPFTESALATADGPDFYAVTGVAPDDVLNIHTEPSASSSKIGEIPHNGRKVKNLGCKDGASLQQWLSMSDSERQIAVRKRWCKILYRGTEGWVAGSFLKEDS